METPERRENDPGEIRYVPLSEGEEVEYTEKASSVLVVDDDPGMRKSLSGILAARGYSTVAEATGKAALRALESALPDVALIDLKLEDMSGLDLLRTIKKRSPGTECIVLTGFASQDSAIEAINLGAFSYIQKPYDIEQLLVTIQRAIEKNVTLKALQQSREKYRVLVDHAGEAIIVAQDGLLKFANPKTVEITGYSHDDLVDIPFTALIHPDDRAMVVERYTRRIRGEKVPGVYSFRIVTSEKSVKWVEIAAVLIEWEGKAATLNFLSDISEKKRLQEQLLQSEKMSALGQLISGVAHELNNPMTGVLGFSQLLLRSKLPEMEKQYAERINKEAERARKIVENLLTFARQRKPERKQIPINEILHRTLDLRAYEMRVNNIEVVRDLDPEVPAIWADEHQLQQVFMNLIINGEQAMLEAHGKGCLKVSTRWMAGEEMLRIEFRDDGPGIPEELLRKIFDPFFTTKEEGKGTGLGLSITFSIIEEHGGRITAANNEAGGATFIIDLPISYVEKTPDKDPGGKGAASVDLKGKKVLVADDEPNVADLIKRAFEAKGMLVEVASDGEKAIEILDKQDVDAVVSDCKMPGKSGFDVFRYCEERKPELTRRFLFLTGDMMAPESMDFMEKHNLPYHTKPFDLATLLSTVETLLKSP